jgi:hypothetical protein
VLFGIACQAVLYTVAYETRLINSKEKKNTHNFQKQFGPIHRYSQREGALEEMYTFLTEYTILVYEGLVNCFFAALRNIKPRHN